jgi:hypothetical protein
MQAEAGATWIQQAGNVFLAPVLHGRIEFSRPLHQAILELSPEVVALELPRGAEPVFLAAVSRFPSLSYITAANLGANDAGLPLWRIEPTDPFYEAIRTARELEIPISFVDDLEPAYPAGRDPLPDPYTITGIGPGRYYQTARQLLEESGQSSDPRNLLDRQREQRIAFRLQRLAAGRRVLFVGGMKHVAPLASLLEHPLEMVDLPPQALDLQVYHPTFRTVRSLSEEMPLMIALYELQRGGPGPPEAWKSPGPPVEPKPESVKPEEKSLDRKSVFNSLQRLLGLRVTPEVEKQISNEQLKHLHAHLLSLNPETWVPPSFDDDSPPAAAPGPAPDFEGEGRFFTYRDANHRREDLLVEYQRLNGECRTADGSLDRQLVYRGLVQLAARYYEENTGEQFKRWQHENLLKFARRYAVLQGRLLPGMLSMIFAARACVDHNYAYEFWDLATFYPWQEPLPAGNDGEGAPVPVFDFDGENLEIDGLRLRHFQFQRTFPRLRQRLVKVPGGGRETPTDDPNDWAGAFESGRICSYPPEDVVIEDYGRYLQKKAVKVQSEAHSRTEPFTTSLLDGIDMRTTLRNWADGQRIYVREERRIDGGTGSVVLIFDQDQGKNHYPWCITWHGEHDQESDMAFYATDRRKKIIGPGIARCEYGGLMLSYPPRRLANVWNDPHYRGAKTKAEVLLFAAIDYCLDKHIVYVASEAPRSFFFSLAQRLGRKLVYLPIGTLSPTSLERIRVFHVLAGHRYREIAKNFIW